MAGKKTSGMVRTMVSSTVRPEDRDHDFIQTPEEAVRIMLSEVEICGEVWEPACGKGAISRVLIGAGLDVTSTDLVNRGYGEEEPLDFLGPAGLSRGVVDNVVTNPPYSLLTEFILRSLQVARRKVILLVPIMAIFSSIRRAKVVCDTRPSLLVTFVRKVPYVDAEGREKPSTFPHTWAVWDKENKSGKIELRIHDNLSDKQRQRTVLSRRWKTNGG